MAASADVRLVAMAMEITAAEAVHLIGQHLVMCSLVAGHTNSNANWRRIQEMADESQRMLLAMHVDPARRHVRCSECGQSRHDAVLSPDGQPGFVVAAKVTP